MPSGKVVRTVHIAWDGAQQRFTASGTHQGHSIEINAPHPGFPDHAPTGFSASELLLASVGSCSLWDVLEILRKARQDVTDIKVRVQGEQDPDPPWAYRRITVHFVVAGARLRRSAVERAVRLSCDRYCSAIATLRGVAEVASSVDIAADTATTDGSAAAADGSSA